MTHRHITGRQWSPMAIESLFDRGELDDWRDFTRAMKTDVNLARTSLRLSESCEDRGSAALVRLLLARYHPGLAPFDADPSPP